MVWENKKKTFLQPYNTAAFPLCFPSFQVFRRKLSVSSPGGTPHVAFKCWVPPPHGHLSVPICLDKLSINGLPYVLPSCMAPKALGTFLWPAALYISYPTLRFLRTKSLVIKLGPNEAHHCFSANLQPLDIFRQSADHGLEKSVDTKNATKSCHIFPLF